jgi:hypothetical protein
MRQISEWLSTDAQKTVNQAVSEMMATGPILTAARSGGLMEAATSGPDTRAQTDAEGLPVSGYWKAGMVPGSAPIKAK